MIDKDRKAQLEHRLYKRYEIVHEEAEEVVMSWIKEQQVTRDRKFEIDLIHKIDERDSKQ